MRLSTRLVSAAAAALAFSNCGALAQSSPGPDRPGRCAEAPARFAIGKPYSAQLAQRARRAAGALAVRQIVPGAAYTMEFSPDRLNLELNRRGVVTAVRCG